MSVGDGAVWEARVDDAPAPPPAIGELDFWLGDWDARWSAADGECRGTSRVCRILGGHVVLERFDGGSALRGISLSTREAGWRQLWVDNAGGRYELVGGPQGSEFVLATAPDERGRARRMRFFDIAADAFSWQWEAGSAAAGWEPLWRIAYRRREAPTAVPRRGGGTLR